MPKILLVEDSFLSRDLLSRRLAAQGFDIVVAGNGEQGLTRAASESLGLVLMDLSMLVLDGWEATRILKNNPATNRIPVIALTAHAAPGDRERALEAGCDEYEVIPVDLPRLVGKIRALLSA